MSAFSVQPFWRRLHMRRKPKKRKIGTAENKIGPSGSRSIQGRGHWQPPIAGIAARLPACHRRIHRMVLFGTEALVQSDCRIAVPNSPGIPQFGSRHNQREAGCGPTIGLRSGGRRFAQPRTRRWYPSRKGGQETRCSAGKLVVRKGSSRHCGNLPTSKPSKANVTERSLPSCSVAVFDDENWPTSVSTIFSGVRIVGPSWILSEKAATFVPFPCRTG